MITNEEKWIRRNQTDCFDWVGSVYLVTIFLPTCIADRWKILDIWSRRKRSPDQSCQTFQCLRIEDIVASGWGRVGHVVFFRSPALLYIRMAQRGASVSLKTCSHTVQTLNRPLEVYAGTLEPGILNWGAWKFRKGVASITATYFRNAG